jgi:hypothetical protein
MAKAAEDAVWLNKVQIALGSIGALLVIATVHYARRAAKAAFAAAEHADAAAKAANSSAESDRTANDLMREHAAIQLRAYCLASDCKMSGFNSLPSFAVQVKNFGQTPAVDLTVWVGIRLLELPVNEQIDIRRPAGLTLSKMTLGPGANANGTIGYDVFPQQEYDALLRGQKAFFIVGDVLYRDVFGRDQVTTFKFAMGGAWGHPQDGALTPCEDGNDAT